MGTKTLRQAPRFHRLRVGSPVTRSPPSRPTINHERRDTSPSWSSGDVTGTPTLRAGDMAVDASYAVKAKGEDLATVTAQDLAARHERAIDADAALLAATVSHLTP